MNYHDLYVAFVYYFNIEKDYFECHEVMEELWMEDGRNPFWQGLLQVAVGLYHHENDNLSGAIKLLTQSLDKLADKQNVECGADIALLYQNTESYLNRLLEEGNFPFSPFTLRITDDNLLQLAIQYVPHEEE